MDELLIFLRRFFDGGRRRVGAVTLALALVAIGGWVRSFAITEHIDFLCDRDNANRLALGNGNIDWMRFHQEGAKRLSDVQFMTARLIIAKDESRVFAWRWNFSGCGNGEYQSEVFDDLKSSNPLLPFECMTQTVWRIPYWLITIPLTIVSVCLLVSVHRQSNQINPITNEGA